MRGRKEDEMINGRKSEGNEGRRKIGEEVAGRKERKT